MRKHSKPRTKSGNFLRRTGYVVAALMVLAGGVYLGKVVKFEWDFHHDGAQLLSKERTLIAHTHAEPVACVKQLGDGPVVNQGGVEVFGDIVAPSIGLTAPVVEGTSDDQLAVAVGHDPASVWPATPGTVVLSAHDVSWFSHLGGLKPGATLEFVSPCVTYTYRVTEAAVVKAGTPIYSGAESRLVLTTCYPLTALYLTQNRLTVSADLVKVVNIATPPADVATSFPVPSTPIPPALSATGLSLSNNSIPLGVIGFAGSPSPAWEQSPAPLEVHRQLLTLYFAALRAAEDANQSWWQAIAPTVPFGLTSPLWGSSIASYGGQVDTLFWVTGANITGLAMKATVMVKGGYDPSNQRQLRPSNQQYTFSVGAVITQGVLHITVFKLTAQ